MHKKDLKEWKKVQLDDYKYVVNEIHSVLDAPCVIFLKGELGAGKTSFAREFCGEEATSPTYSLVQEYHDILHADFYRIESQTDIIDLDLSSYIEGKNYFLAEWGEQYFREISSYIPSKFQFYTLSFEIVSESDFRNLLLESIDPLLS